MSARRRPRPTGMMRGATPPTECPIAPRPPPGPMPPGATPRPTSVPRLGSLSARGSSERPPPMTKVASAEAAADAELLRMRFSIGELQAKCDRQEKELAAFRQQGADAGAVVTSNTTKAQVFRGLMSSSMGVPIQGAPAAARDRANQNGDGVMAQELDLIHCEAAQKSKDLRKLQETLTMVRAELNQEKMVSNQYREQVDGLEMQLRNAMQKQHRAEGE